MVELVYEAPLLMLIEPLGAVGSDVDVVKDASLPYEVPALFCAAIR